MKDISSLVASDVMHSPVVCAAPDELLRDVERRLVEARVTGMPVVEGGRLVGIISRSDLTRVPVLVEALDAYAAERMEWIGVGPTSPRPAGQTSFQGSANSLRVKDVMARQVVVCEPGTRVTTVAAEMWRHRVHRIVVIEGEVPVGIVSSLDLARLVADQPE
jgi:CBS domain-containing protein